MPSLHAVPGRQHVLDPINDTRAAPGAQVLDKATNRDAREERHNIGRQTELMSLGQLTKRDLYHFHSLLFGLYRPAAASLRGSRHPNTQGLRSSIAGLLTRSTSA